MFFAQTGTGWGFTVHRPTFTGDGVKMKSWSLRTGLASFTIVRVGSLCCRNKSLGGRRNKSLCARLLERRLD